MALNAHGMVNSSGLQLCYNSHRVGFFRAGELLKLQMNPKLCLRRFA